MGEVSEAVAVSIADYGAFLPIYRIDFAGLPKFYRKRARGAETLVVPGLDEDSITMAYAATREFLAPEDQVDAIVFATLSPPFYYKKASALLGRALSFPEDILTFDIGGSPKACMDALRLGASLISSGDAERVLMVSSDCVYTEYGWETEVFPSAGAVAFLMSRDGFARLGESARSCLEVFDFWKLEEDNQLQFHMDVQVLSFQESSMASVERLAQKTGTKLEDYAFVCFQQLHPRFSRRNPMLRRVEKEKLAATDVISKVGNLFTASLPLSMALGFEKAQRGDKICAISYGSGESEAWELEITAEPPKRSVEEKLTGGMKIDVGKYWTLTHGRRERTWKK